MANDIFREMWNILKENDFQIDLAIKSEFICTNCKKIMIKPCNVPCGCGYCYDCLKTYLNDEEKVCIGDSDDCKRVLINIDNNVFIDQAVNMKISNIVSKCPNESCEFHGELKKMADHMKTCSRQPVACPYHTIGCDKNNIVVEELKQHLIEENLFHARLLMDFVENCRNEMKLLKTNVLDLQEENRRIKEQMESKQVVILALKKNVAKLLDEKRTLMELEILQEYHQDKQIVEIILAMQMKSEEQNEEIVKNKKKWNEFEINQEQMEARIDILTHENADMTRRLIKTENAMRTLETKLIQIQANQNCGEFLWCIKNWEETKERSLKGIETEIFSDIFYSHKNGYKMRLELFPGGPLNSCLALYLIILRGEFDNFLQWPFRHDVKFELLNQETGLPHVSKIMSPGEDPDCWEKPCRERNFGDGFPDFIELSELSSNAALCQGDQIWIRATVQLKH